MAPQYSLPTRLSDYIAFLLPWAHGHQLKAIGDFVATIIEQQTACQAQLARYFGKQEAAVNPFMSGMPAFHRGWVHQIHAHELGLFRDIEQARLDFTA